MSATIQDRRLGAQEGELKHKRPHHDVFGPNWEGPYNVLRAVEPGVYKLAHADGREVKKSWNAEHLKKYF